MGRLKDSRLFHLLHPNDSRAKTCKAAGCDLPGQILTRNYGYFSALLALRSEPLKAVLCGNLTFLTVPELQTFLFTILTRRAAPPTEMALEPLMAAKLFPLTIKSPPKGNGTAEICDATFLPRELELGIPHSSVCRCGPAPWVYRAAATTPCTSRCLSPDTGRYQQRRSTSLVLIGDTFFDKCDQAL